MKKIALLFLLLLVALVAHADTRSAQIIQKMGAKIARWETYSVEFAVEISGHEDPGRYWARGQSYYVVIRDDEIYSDGRTRWMVNNGNEEVMLEQIDPNDKSIFSNPTQLFSFPDEAFSHSYAGRQNNLDVVVLQPKFAGAMERIRLEIDPTTDLPKSIEYTMEQASDPIRIRVISFQSAPDVPASRFVFDRAKYKGYEVIDFR